MPFPQFALKETIIYANLLIGIFNLLPIFPLDGGQMLSAVLCKFYSRGITEDVINKTSNFVTILLTVLSSIGIIYIKNIAIFFIIAYLWFIRISENKKHKLKERVRKIIKQNTEKIVL